MHYYSITVSLDCVLQKKKKTKKQNTKQNKKQKSQIKPLSLIYVAVIHFKRTVPNLNLFIQIHIF